MIVALSTLLLLVGAVGAATNPWNLQLDGNTTVSGISAGGFMAAQMAIAFSQSIVGAGIFAGGPFYCAQGQLTTALTECTDYPFLLDPSLLVSAAQNYASNNQIDALSNLARQKYYLYSGTADQTVSTVVVKAVQTVATSLGAQDSNFATQYSLNAGHGVPTLNYGVQCSDSSSPYINNCNYDGAGAIFKQLYGSLKGRGQRNDSNWQVLNTVDYVPAGWLDVTLSLGDSAYVYVPTQCYGGKKKCRLHIVFHGCSQATEFLGDVFYKNTGYAEWAETNGFVLLFPQAASNVLYSNPLGCFDWWGFTEASYATNQGPQMVTFKNMAKYLGAIVH